MAVFFLVPNYWHCYIIIFFKGVASTAHFEINLYTPSPVKNTENATDRIKNKSGD